MMPRIAECHSLLVATNTDKRKPFFTDYRINHVLQVCREVSVTKFLSLEPRSNVGRLLTPA
jgi:hypothetical protein